MQNERKIAIDILVKIISENAYNNITLRKALKAQDDFNITQKAFVTEMVNGVLRNLIYIDYVINSFSKLHTDKMKVFIACVIRCSVYQILFMDKVPNFAACDEAVKIVKRRGFSSLSGFVNGILRNVAKNGKNIKLPNKTAEPVKHLSVKYSCPEWIITHLLTEYDIGSVEQICAVSALAPEVSICVNTLKTSREKLVALFKKNSIEVRTSPANDKLLYIKGAGDITSLEMFKNGLFHVMDENSMNAVFALNPLKGDTVIDMCAAPGGKSFHMAYLMENMGTIYANDIFEHKIDLVKNGAKRLGITNIKAQISDASKPNDSFCEIADKVLVDAPCSGFGIMRKKPDIKYRKSADDITSLVKIQREMLNTASQYVKPSGVLVYSTCTLSKAENRYRQTRMR
jgi:16S rRNA (cytosine967-C5)-methyltransferase